jgi:hypothetical protein
MLMCHARALSRISPIVDFLLLNASHILLSNGHMNFIPVSRSVMQR